MDICIALLLVWSFLFSHPSRTTHSMQTRKPDMAQVKSAANLHVIGIEIMRYVKDNGSYPDELSDLHLDDPGAQRLTCPIDGKPYVYIKPAKADVPLHTVVAYEATASSRGTINILCADGDVEGFREVDAKKKIDQGER